MLKLFKKEKALREYPVFNLEITRDKTSPPLREYDKTSRYIGEFVVQNSGRLDYGKDITLHTYETILGFCEDHIHFPEGGIIDIITENGGPSLKAEFENSRFTLKGFYSSIRVANNLKKSEILTNHIKKFNSHFQFDSIAVHEKTRLKL